MEQIAYDFARFENSGRRTGEKRPPELKTVRGGKSKAVEALHYTRLILGCAIVLGLAVSLLISKANLIELTTEVQQKNKLLSETKSEYNYYVDERDSLTGLSSVEAVATQLGLVKADSSQITYVQIETVSRIERETSPVERWASVLGAGTKEILSRFDP